MLLLKGERVHFNHEVTKALLREPGPQKEHGPNSQEAGSPDRVALLPVTLTLSPP